MYVCTPLLILPIFLLAQARWSAQDIYLFVAAFGAMGHHLPGMIRAYGDRALFQRFKWRFIFAPIFLVVVCAAFSIWDLKGIVLVAFVWGVWHGMMQTYGFCRIYDAKVGSFAAANAASGFRIVRDLVRHCRPSLTAANDRYTRNLLFRRWTIHPAGDCSELRSKGYWRWRSQLRDCSWQILSGSWIRGQATKPGEARASRHEHNILVVLQ